MKKFLLFATVILFIVFNMQTSSYAEENVIVYEDTYSETFSPDEYLPPEIKDILNGSGFGDISDTDINSVFKYIQNLIAISFSVFAKTVSGIFSVIIISSIINRLVENKSVQTIVNYITTLCALKYMLDIFMLLFEETSDALKSLSDIIGLSIPAFSSILLLGGGSFSALTSTLSLSAVLILIETLLSELLVPSVTILLYLFVFERISPQFSQINLFKSVKKFMMTCLAFVTTVMITVISFQSILSSNKDSLSTRTVKFAAANLIPVVGNAVGESLKTVLSGLSYIKSTVGISVGISILISVLPAVVNLVLIKLIFRFFSIASGFLQSPEFQNIFDTSVSFIDLLLGIIICVTSLSILVVTIFVRTAFGFAV